MTWYERLRHTICLLYQAWGGDCSDLDKPQQTPVECLLGMFNASGPPSLSGQELADFLANLTALESLLDEPGNTLALGLTEDLRAMISALRSHFGVSNP